MSRPKKAGLLVRVIVLLLVAYMIFLFWSVRQRISDTRAEIAQLTVQVADQIQTNTELQNAIENRDDPSFVEDVARERLGLVSPNDKVFFISD